MRTPKFLMIAEGSIKEPFLNICLNSEDDGIKAIVEAKEKATALFAAGYFRFGVFHLGETDTEVTRFRLDKAPPIISEG